MTVAKTRSFGDDVAQAQLAKLIRAEHFLPDPADTAAPHSPAAQVLHRPPRPLHEVREVGRRGPARPRTSGVLLVGQDRGRGGIREVVRRLNFGANPHDSMALTATVDAIRQRGGRPWKRPAKLLADKGYDFERCRRDLRARGIKPRIARRSIESGQHFGRHRWVVERTLAWINRFRSGASSSDTNVTPASTEPS